MAKRILTKRLKRSIGKILMFSLLILYTAGALQLNALYSSHNHLVTITHSEAQEQNACHRLIYHNDTAQGCDHDSHLMVSDKCQMCDLVNHSDQNALSGLTFSTRKHFSDHFHFYKSNFDSWWAVISSSRAPPVLA